VLADLVATRVSDYVVTESGFGADMGFEKFVGIKCRASGLLPHAAVLVATVRALKMHGGGPKVTPGRPLPPAYTREDRALVQGGLANLRAHLAILRTFGVPAVVAINAFPSDSEAEHGLIQEAAVAAGAEDAVVARNWADGGDGAADLARAVERAACGEARCAPLYPPELGARDKIERIACAVYGADRVSYSAEAEAKLESFSSLGFGDLPICMAKTQYSLSHDPSLKGAPRGFCFPVTDLRLAAGAGFLCPLSGAITTMPGLPSKPGYLGMDLDVETGRIRGLS